MIKSPMKCGRVAPTPVDVIDQLDALITEFVRSTHATLRWEGQSHCKLPIPKRITRNRPVECTLSGYKFWTTIG